MSLLDKLALDKTTLTNSEINEVEKLEQPKQHRLTIVHTPCPLEIAEEKEQLRLAKIEVAKIKADKKRRHDDWLYITNAKKPLFNKIVIK